MGQKNDRNEVIYFNKIQTWLLIFLQTTED